MLLDDALYEKLAAWVRRWYRERIAPDDLRDPKLIEESRAAPEKLDALLSLS